MSKSSNLKYQTSTIPKPRVALVADWLYGGGAEKVVEQLHALYPDAPIYTSYCSDEWRKRLDNKVVTGYLQKPFFVKTRKFLPLLRQLWFARLDLSEFDLVISSTGNGEAKFARATKPGSKHISYCHTPVHFYWRHYNHYLKNPGFKPAWLVRLGLRLLVRPLRNRDYKAAQRVDVFIANSSHIKADIKKYYGRDSVVIFPPIDTKRFSQTKLLNDKSSNDKLKPHSGFITVGRQVPLKRTDIIVQACKQLKVPLIVIGRGPEHSRLLDITGPTIHFRADVEDDEMPKLVADAEAFLFASFEDFGIAPVEAMAAGTPVIAYKAGGALDYVIPGKTGEFFDEQSVDSLVDAIQNFDHKKYKPEILRAQADLYSIANFKKAIKQLVKDHNS